jgi:hypothetical protein
MGYCVAVGLEDPNYPAYGAVVSYVRQENTTLSDKKTIQSSRAKTFSFDKISRTNLALFAAADKGTGWALGGVTVSGLGSLMDEWSDAVTGGNPKGKTLDDLTMLLYFFFRDTEGDGQPGHIFLRSNRGSVRIAMSRWCWGGIRVYTRAANNYSEYFKEKHSQFDDALTLTVMRTLHPESIVQNFLSGR